MLQEYYNLSKLCYVIFIQISVLCEHVINIPFFYIIIYTGAIRNICILFYLFQQLTPSIINFVWFSSTFIWLEKRWYYENEMYIKFDKKSLY